jgi:thiamine transport system permease protein
MRLPRPLQWFAALWTLAFVAGTLVVPLWALYRNSAALPDAALLDPLVLATVRRTAGQALFSVFFSALIGIPLGLWIAGRSRAAEILLAIPYGVPTVVAGMAGVAWLGRTGLLPSDWLYTLKAVVLAHVFLNAPLFALWTSQACAAIPAPWIETARTLGAGPLARFRLLTWPAIRGAVGGAAIQAFSLCSMSFALVLLLGGGPPVETLETAIYGHVRYAGLDLNAALACAGWQILVTLPPWILLLIFEERAGIVAIRLDRNSRARAARGAVAASAVFVLPYLALLGGGFWKSLIQAEWWSELARPLSISLGLALFVASLATVTAVLGALAPRAVARPASLWLTLPGGFSALVLGLGLWLAYQRWVDPFEGSFFMIGLLQSTLFVPLAYRSVYPLARHAQRGLFETAVTLGAPPLTAFRLAEWPRWRKALGFSFAMAAGASLAEVAAVSFFYSEDLIPLPLLITRWMGQYRFEDAQALAALLFLISVLTIVTAGKLGHWGERTHG